MNQSWIIIVLLHAILLASCGGNVPASSGNPPKQIDSELVEGQSFYLNVFIERVKLLTDPKDLNGTGEFRLFVIASDNYGNSSGLFCPSGETISVQKGSEIPNPCLAGLYFDEERIDEIHLLIFAVDEDNSPKIADLAYEGVVAGLSEGFEGAIKAGKMLPVGGSAASLGIGMVISFITGEIKNWVEEADIYGSQVVTLRKNNDWGAGERVTLQTHDGGLEISYSVTKSVKPDNEEVVIWWAVEPTPDFINNQTNENITVQSYEFDSTDVTVKVENTKKGTFLHILRNDGKESDIGPFAKGVYEVGPNGNFIVYCTNDGQVFATRIGENHVEPIGKIKGFHMININAQPQLSISISGSTSYTATIREYLENQSETFPIPRKVTH